MTNALAYTDTINKLPRRTAQVQERRPGITTTGFSTGKKLPHNGAKWLQLAAPMLSCDVRVNSTPMVDNGCSASI